MCAARLEDDVEGCFGGPPHAAEAALLDVTSVACLSCLRSECEADVLGLAAPNHQRLQQLVWLDPAEIPASQGDDRSVDPRPAAKCDAGQRQHTAKTQ